MMTVKLDVEDRVLERIRKLLRLANDARGNEHEAALAARRASELMEEHGLSTATIEASGGTGESRTQAESDSFERGRAPWMAELMRVVAEASFCLCEVDVIGSGKKTRVAFRLFGRVSAVAGAFALADYLKQTIWRLSTEADVGSPHYFRSGCAERLGERVSEGHEQALAEQRERAEKEQREQAARAAHPGAAPSSTALTIVLADYAQSERDGNEDLRRGLPAGTTAAKHAAAQAEREVRDRRYKQLVDGGVDSGVAYNMAHMDMDHDRAVKFEAEWQANNAARAAEPEQPKRRRTRADEAREDAQWRREMREAGRRSDPSWVAGRDRGDEVSLARQLSRRSDKKLTRGDE
jgi:Protein of unknown function (DUF2786)